MLDALLTAIPVQAATVMKSPSNFAPPITDLYRKYPWRDVTGNQMERWVFYDRIASPSTTLMIAIGEQRREMKQSVRTYLADQKN